MRRSARSSSDTMPIISAAVRHPPDRSRSVTAIDGSRVGPAGLTRGSRWTRAVFSARPAAVNFSVAGAVRYAVLIAAGFVIALYRYPSEWRYLMWSEDGGIFFEQALRIALPEALMVPYAGYIHFVPRAIAEATTLVPVEDAATLSTWIVAAVTSVIAAAIVFFSAAHLRNGAARVLLWLLVVAAPVAGMEVALSSANLQWYLLGGAFFAVFGRRVGWTSTVLSAVVVAMALTSSVLALLFLPFVVMRALVFRTAWDSTLAVVATVCAVVQLVGVLGTSRPGSDGPLSAWEVGRLYLVAVADLAWGGSVSALALQAAPRAAMVVGVCLTALTIYLAWAVRRWSALPCVAMVVSVAYFLPVMMLTKVAAQDPFDYLGVAVGTRYIVFPIFAIGVVIVVLVDRLFPLARRSPTVRLRISVVICLAALLFLQAGAIATSYRAVNPREIHLTGLPTWREAVAAAKETCASGAQVAYLAGDAHTPDFGTISVRCEDLAD
ncbi:hypothetical protein ACFT30_05860 [Microbacterium ureisolvens]|uniref:hypothetical protein n=1 Tax=Microbacterium ureisolvens TaxID=2781186 RepID=UPI00363FE23B